MKRKTTLSAMEQQQLRTRRNLSTEDNDSVMVLDAIDLNLAPFYHTSRRFTRNSIRSNVVPSYVDGHYIFHANNINHINADQTSRRVVENNRRNLYHNLTRIVIEEGMESEALTCSICLAELSVGSKATRLPCSHFYHEECVMKWLDRSNTCPLCRQIVSNVSS